MADNPYAQYRRSGPMIPGTGPKPPAGFVRPDQATPLTPIGDRDPNYIRQVENIRGDASIRAAAAAAAIKAASDRQAEADKRRFEARQQYKLDPQKEATMRAAQGQLDRLQYLYSKGPGRTKGLAGFRDFLPNPENAQFDTAGAGLGEVGLAAFRVPGQGSQSDTELRAFIDANRPNAKNFDTSITEKIGNLQNRLNENYRAYNLKRPPAKKYGDEPRVIDFNSLPD
jgi:hypothetical protein